MNGFSAAVAVSLPGTARQTFSRACGPCTAIIARSLRGTRRKPGARSAASFAEPRDVLVGRRGVDDEAEEILAQEIDDQVVEHAAVGAQQARIERLAGDLQLVDVVRERVAQECARGIRIVAVDVDDAHVRDVEHAGIVAYRVVLVDLRAVVDRHVPPAEIDHPRAGRAVGGVERGGL